MPGRLDPGASWPQLEARSEDNKGPELLASVIALTVLSTLFAFLRLFFRFRAFRQLCLDDYFIIIAIILQWLQNTFIILSVTHGEGHHATSLTLSQQTAATFWFALASSPGVLSLAIPKLAVIALLTRLLNPSTLHSRVLWTLGTVCFINLALTIIINWARCRPARAIFDATVVDAQCLDGQIYVDFCIYASTFSATLDLYLAVYPAVVLYNLQMTLWKRLALIVALGFGAVACAVAIYKITRLPSLVTKDFTYEVADLTVWTVVESSTITIAACIPTLHPLYDLLCGPRCRVSFRSGFRRLSMPHFSRGQQVQEAAAEVQLGHVHKGGGRATENVNKESSGPSTDRASKASRLQLGHGANLGT